MKSAIVVLACASLFCSVSSSALFYMERRSERCDARAELSWYTDINKKTQWHSVHYANCLTKRIAREFDLPSGKTFDKDLCDRVEKGWHVEVFDTGQLVNNMLTCVVPDLGCGREFTTDPTVFRPEYALVACR